MRGTETLSLAPSRSREKGIVVFEYRGREWQWRELAELLARAESRWVLFQQAGTHGPVDDMLPLFSDESTFAVARQNGFRGWQKLLFSTAPFQTLQAGEASRVFAPLSNQILVDRAKLLALGLPKLSGYGSNWYLLFWKAAAAGWSSYSAGGTAKLDELVGLPFYEAQFVHALLVDPALARLKPRDPLLARGNITRTTAGGMGFRGLPRVMILSPYLPYPLSHGGAVRIFSLCQALAGSIDFVLVCFRERNDRVDYEKLHEVFREVYVVAIDEKHANPHLPEQVSGYESTSMRALIPDICLQLRIDILQFEYTQMAAYRESAAHLPAILVEHDITFTLHRQLAERDGSQRSWREYQNWLKFECDRLRAFDEVWTMSEHDRQQAICAGSGPASTIAVPNGVDLARFWGGSETGGAIEILYVGSFRHRPNYLGFEELRQQIMPAVWTEFPDMRLRVVAGPNHEKHWEGTRETDPRIVVHGFVEDIAPLYRQCALVVVPLPVSAGTNIKVMEALASERTVVTTPVGCVGLDLRDGQDAMVRELGPGFAAAICDLLRDGAMRRAIAGRARKTAEERFGWKAIAETADAAYERLLPKATAVGGREPGRRG
jgi:glycosyltransferase involved in cell wall biosynthesis